MTRAGAERLPGAKKRPNGAALSGSAPLHLLAAWLPPVLWACLILSASGDRFASGRTEAWLLWLLDIPWISDPASLARVANVMVRKCAHFVEYGVLGVLLGRALASRPPAVRTSLAWLWVLSLALVCSSVDELYQASSAVRTGSPADVVLDMAGAATGATLFSRLRRRPALP